MGGFPLFVENSVQFIELALTVVGNQVHIRHFHTCMLVFLVVDHRFAISFTC